MNNSGKDPAPRRPRRPERGGVALDQHAVGQLAAAQVGAGQPTPAPRAAHDGEAAQVLPGQVHPAQLDRVEAEERSRVEAELPRGRGRAREDKGVVEQVVGSTAFRSMLRSAGTVIGREISRSLFGTRRRR